MPTRKRGKIWHYDFMIRGRRYRGAIPEARTKSQAERVESQKREEVYSGTYEPFRKDATFRQFVEAEYLPIAKENTRKFTCNVGYQSKKLIEQFGDRLLGEITHFEIERWLLEQRRTYSGATVNHFIKRLNAIYNRAAAAGYIEQAKNPMRLVSKVEETPRAKRRLSREEEARIAAAAAELGLEYVTTAMIILIETGMRPMEFFEMECSQVFLSEGIIKPISYKTGWRRGGSAQPRERIVPLTDRARAEFEGLVADAIARSDEKVFAFKSIRKAWTTVCERAEVKDFWL